MKAFKMLIGAFICGGAACVAGQALMLFWGGILGAEGAALVDTLALACLGIIGLLLVVLGLYPKLQEIGGMGAGMPISGLVGIIGTVYLGILAQTGSYGKAAKQTVLLAATVIGCGALLSILFGLLAWFAKGVA
ncbi:MAG: SpoVA/SpoVAEb family sporulation membrane protein [Treponema sp.]|jgi:hypothetical protein|nr:SpoVA/SpoVAEb family sporulation membrane protein [Treponema sp.]